MLPLFLAPLLVFHPSLCEVMYWQPRSHTLFSPKQPKYISKIAPQGSEFASNRTTYFRNPQVVPQNTSSSSTTTGTSGWTSARRVVHPPSPVATTDDSPYENPENQVHPTNSPDGSSTPPQHDDAENHADHGDPIDDILSGTALMTDAELRTYYERNEQAKQQAILNDQWEKEERARSAARYAKQENERLPKGLPQVANAPPRLQPPAQNVANRPDSSNDDFFSTISSYLPPSSSTKLPLQSAPYVITTNKEMKPSKYYDSRLISENDITGKTLQYLHGSNVMTANPTTSSSWFGGRTRRRGYGQRKTRRYSETRQRKHGGGRRTSYRRQRQPYHSRGPVANRKRRGRGS